MLLSQVGQPGPRRAIPLVLHFKFIVHLSHVHKGAEDLVDTGDVVKALRHALQAEHAILKRIWRMASAALRRWSTAPLTWRLLNAGTAQEECRR